MNRCYDSILICAIFMRFVASESCLESVETITSVLSCPSNEIEWRRRSEAKQCSKFEKQCPEAGKSVYHCVINTFGNETLEVCAPEIVIIGHSCVEYNVRGKTIQESQYVKCNESCPFSYQSTASYKYKICFQNVEKKDDNLKNITTLLKGCTGNICDCNAETNWKIVAVVMIIINIAFSAFILWTTVLKRKYGKKPKKIKAESHTNENDVEEKVPREEEVPLMDNPKSDNYESDVDEKVSREGRYLSCDWTDFKDFYRKDAPDMNFADDNPVTDDENFEDIDVGNTIRGSADGGPDDGKVAIESKVQDDTLRDDSKDAAESIEQKLSSNDEKNASKDTTESTEQKPSSNDDKDESNGVFVAALDIGDQYLAMALAYPDSNRGVIPIGSVERIAVFEKEKSGHFYPRTAEELKNSKEEKNEKKMKKIEYVYGFKLSEEESKESKESLYKGILQSILHRFHLALEKKIKKANKPRIFYAFIVPSYWTDTAIERLQIHILDTVIMEALLEI